MKTKSFPNLSPACRRLIERRNFGCLAGVLAAAALVGISCGRKSDPQILATVGTNEISVAQFQEQMIRRGGARPELLDKQALLEEMIEQEALFVRAVNAGLDKDPELQRAWRNLLIGKLREKDLAPRIAAAEVTPAELKAAYDAERDRHTRPAAMRLAVLYLRINPVMKREKIAELQQRMTEARQKALASDVAAATGFGSLAITSSEDQATRYKGGIVGWVERDRDHAWLGPAPLAAGFALKTPGDVSEVVTDSQGIYLLKLLDRRETTVIPLAEVEASLRQRLLVEKRRQIEQAFAREARELVAVEAHPDRLARIASTASPAVAETRQPPSFP